MKVQIKGFISLNRMDPWDKEPRFCFYAGKMDEYGHATVMPYSFEVDIPDEFDPRAKQVELLRAEKTKAMAEFQARITEIDRQISKLTALEFAA